jgi:hypothetical protein
MSMLTTLDPTPPTPSTTTYALRIRGILSGPKY